MHQEFEYTGSGWLSPRSFVSGASAGKTRKPDVMASYGWDYLGVFLLADLVVDADSQQVPGLMHSVVAGF